MDQFDRAQEIELAERQHLLGRQRQQADLQDKPSLSHCEGCGEEIPAARRAIRGVTRCVSCQKDFEQDQKRGIK